MGDSASFALNLLYIVTPFILAWYIKRSSQARWYLFWRGVFFFVLAQIFYWALYYGFGQLFFFGNERLPFSVEGGWIFYVVVLAAISALSMESLRWLGLRYSGEQGWLFSGTLMFVAGFGGIKLVLNGVGGILLILFMTLLQNVQVGTTTTLPFTGYDLTFTDISNTPPPNMSWIKLAIPWAVSVLTVITPFILEPGLSVFIWLSVRHNKISWYLTAWILHFIMYGLLVFVNGFIFTPASVQKITLPPFIAPITMLLLVIVSITIFIWGHRKSVMLENLNLEKAGGIDAH